MLGFTRGREWSGKSVCVKSLSLLLFAKPWQRVWFHRGGSRPMQFKQFDRFVEDLRERQYAPLQLLLTTREQYSHLGDLWRRRMWSDPPPGKAAVVVRTVSAVPATVADPDDSAISSFPATPRGPDAPPSEHVLHELFGHPDDGRICQTLDGVSLSEDGAQKALCGGDLLITTKVITNLNTGAPTDWIYTIINKSLRDADITIDFDQSKGVGAVTLEYKQERNNLIHTIVKAKGTDIVAWLRPRKKKSVFAWENNSDDEDEMGGRRKKKSIRIVAEIKVKKLWSREVSCQVLSGLCSAVFNVRAAKIFDLYFSGRPCENVFEWLQFHEDAARTDNISPVTELGRLVAFLLGTARHYALQILGSFQALGEVRNKVLLRNLKSGLLQKYGPHNTALMVVCAAGNNKQVKELLSGDTDGNDLSHGASIRISYATKETYGPRPERSKPLIFGRDPRAPEGWPHTLPFVLRLPDHGKSWASHTTGQTALHLACAHGNFHVASTLVERGWKCDQSDYFGRTPYEVATMRGHLNVAALMHKSLWQRPRWVSLPSSVNILKASSNFELAEADKGKGGELLPMHVVTAVNTLRELRRGSALAAEEAAVVENVWSTLQKLDPEAIEWKKLESQRNVALSANDQAAALVAAANALEDGLRTPDKDSDEEGAAEEHTPKVTDDPNIKFSKPASPQNCDGKVQDVAAAKEKDVAVDTGDLDADNFDMLNLWHVCLAGNSHCITAALLYGHKLRYCIGDGWRSVPCSPKLNYQRHGATWTDRGGKNVIHALALQKYPIPGSQMKPCLLSFLNNEWPAYRPDIKGLTPTDYAKRLGHKALHGVMFALIRPPKQPAAQDESSDDDDEASNEGGISDSSAHDKDNSTAKKRKEEPCKDWEYTKPATNNQNRALAAVCTGAQGEAGPFLVREAIFGGKYLFTAGSSESPVLQCRNRDNETFPVRYDPGWTCRFEPTVDEDLPSLDGLGFTALHIAALSGQCEITGMLIASGWDPLARTARGVTPVDLARLMGWEALHHALQEVSEGSTSNFFGSLSAYVESRSVDYRDKIADIVDESKRTWAHIDAMYTQEKERKLEEERRAQTNGRENRKNRRKKKKKKTSKRQNKASSRQGPDGGSGLDAAGTAGCEEGGADADSIQGRDVESQKKTFFRGRLNFRSKPIVTGVNLATWTCNCTTINTASATSCKFCFREKGFSVWVCDCTQINEISLAKCKFCHLLKNPGEKIK